MSKYTVSFQSVDFGRRVEMALFDNELHRFVVPTFEHTVHGRAFMAGSPEEFRDFVMALVAAWNEFQAEQRKQSRDISELYATDFMQGVFDAPNQRDRPPDQGVEGS